MIIRHNYNTIDCMNDIRLKFIDSGHATTDSGWSGNVRSPMYARLYYILGGDPYVVIDKEIIPLKVGYCYLFPTGFSFCHACDATMEQLYFHINLNDLNGFDLLRNCTQFMEYKPDESVAPCLLKYFYSDDPIDALKLRREVYTSILTLFEKYSVNLSASRYSRCVLLAVDYIKSHLTLQLDIGEIAASLFVSESTLAKKFKQELGMTIGSYIDSMIMFEAEQLLLKSDLSILQISERFGFCDQFYFSRRFKEKYGDPPKRYRQQRLI